MGGGDWASGGLEKVTLARGANHKLSVSSKSIQVAAPPRVAPPLAQGCLLLANLDRFVPVWCAHGRGRGGANLCVYVFSWGILRGGGLRIWFRRVWRCLRWMTPKTRNGVIFTVPTPPPALSDKAATAWRSQEILAVVPSACLCLCFCWQHVNFPLPTDLSLQHHPPSTRACSKILLH